MIKSLMMVAVATALIGLSPASVRAGPTCAGGGAYLWCNDGTTYYTLGDQTIDNRGHVWRHLGDLSFGSNGQVIQRLPGQTYTSDPLAWPPVGQGPLLRGPPFR